MSILKLSSNPKQLSHMIERVGFKPSIIPSFYQNVFSTPFLLNQSDNHAAADTNFKLHFSRID